MSISRRNSLGGSPQSPVSTQDLKHRVITCLNKLSDRDTLAVASSELDSIAKTLTHDSFSPFLNCIHNTDSSTKPPVRKQCVNLLTLLSNSHGDALSPFISKMISTVVRRLRDPDSAIRSACIDAVTAMSSRITKPSFSVSFLKPLMETLTIEQDHNSQIGSALCLGAAIEASPEPEVAQLKKSLPRLGKLAKSEGFKAKAALLVLIGSIIGVGGASSRSVLDWLVPSVVEFLSCKDWAVRKAAAEALGRVSLAERDLATLYKDTCLNALEGRRFDKVKIVRETMNNTLELWKELAADASEVIFAPSSSRSSLDNISKSSHEIGFKTPLQPKKTVPTNRSPPSVGSLVTTAKKASSLKSTDRDDSSKSTFCKLDSNKKPCDWRIEIAVPGSASSNVAFEDKFEKNDYDVSKSNNMEQSANCKLETKHVLFSKGREDKVNTFSAYRRSRVVPLKGNENDALVSNAPEEKAYEKDVEDISLIRKQLLQIENQQSNLLDLLQRFMGNSQTGLNSLETRVHGLEIALDEISYDIALSSGRIPNTDIAENTCCKLPGAEFLSSKFWRRTEGRYSTSRFSVSGASPMLNNALHHVHGKDAGPELYKSDNHRLQPQNGGHPYRMSRNIMKDTERLQVYSTIGQDRTSPVARAASVDPTTRSSA